MATHGAARAAWLFSSSVHLCLNCGDKPPSTSSVTNLNVFEDHRLLKTMALLLHDQCCKYKIFKHFETGLTFKM